MADAGSINGRTFERHVQTILAAVIIGLVSWVGLTVTKNTEKLGRFEERIIALNHSLEVFERSTEKRLENALAKIDILQLRLIALEHRRGYRYEEGRDESGQQQQ